MGLNGSLAYAFHAVRGLSLSVDASWTHAFEIQYLLGKNRWTGNLHLGYAF